MPLPLSVIYGELSRRLCRSHHVMPPDARRNACLQEHSDEAAHEPHRGEVSEVRNPLTLYHLQGDPSTPLRSVFGMTYKEKAPLQHPTKI